MAKWSNDDILEKLRSQNETEVNRAMAYLYQRLFEKVQALILKNSGSEAEVAELFHEGLIAFLKLLRRGRIDEKVRVEAYIYGICRNLWLKELKKRKEMSSLSEEQYDIAVEEVPVSTFIDEEQGRIFTQLMEALGPACKQLLTAFYYERKKMKEIVETLSYSSEQVAKNKKAKCMKKLRALLEEKKLDREFFY